MKKVNSIRIFFVVAVIVLIFAVRYSFGSGRNLPEEELPIETEEVLPTEIPLDTEPVLTVNQNINYKYLIIEEGDYLTVYYADRKTVFEYTGIRYSDLDDDGIRQKIRKGYWIEDEEQLYGFLENYDT